jgi:hypothetical protein
MAEGGQRHSLLETLETVDDRYRQVRNGMSGHPAEPIR